MLKKLSFAALALAFAAMAFGAVAPVAHAADPGPERDHTYLRGRGVLDAQGDGLVAVKGKMDLNVTADEGVLLVRDLAGDAVVRVEGDGRTTNWNGFTVYLGFDGDAHVIGTHVAVIVVARNIDLHVVGVGWAYLKGQGTFEVNNHGPFRWTNEGAFASVVAE